MAERYDPKSFEERWMTDWESKRLYSAPDRPPEDKPKRFIMEMFPYPSGDLHVGHVENYAIADAIARYSRMSGALVMHPMGYDAFGLPAENAAIKQGIHPREYTTANIAQMRSSFKRLGYSYDWDREVISCEPAYYRWNQWIFLKFYERGLAYRKESPVNWCPSCKTVLAKEQLSTGVCWRCGSVPEVRDLTQWYLKITDYSDRLLDDMKLLEWPESILSAQRHWIGRSRGAEVTFKIKPDAGESIDLPVFTTRPDTLWGATFVVLAPEHPIAQQIAQGSDVEEELSRFLEETRRMSEVDRLASKDKKGLRLPAVAINPVSGEEVSVWVADYVLMGYGTGGIMAVPAHDQRDLDFARRHDLPVRDVISPEGSESPPNNMTEAYAGPGVMVNSGRFDGTAVVPETGAGIDDVVAWLEQEGRGRAVINYRQRDWLVSRQRYWGTPIPIIHCSDCGEVPVRLEDLPVLLPEVADYTPSDDAVSPLANATDWVTVNCPSCGGEAKRDTDTLDTFFDSSWYFLRYCDPNNESEPFAPDNVAAWCPVDMYIGGTEHAVMHLIYARFFVKAFQDMGLVGFPEPFRALFNQGYVYFDGREMSKSTGHSIDAAETIDRYGADAARTFMLFCGPPWADYNFGPEGMEEIGRVAFSWLSRVWRLLSNVIEQAPTEDLDQAVHRSVKAITADMEDIGLNTAIAKLMSLVNDFSKLGGPVPRASAETFLKMLAPIAPFISEELWHRYGNKDSIHLERWPEFDESLAALDVVTIVLQVKGKVRDTVEVLASISEEEMKSLALANPKVAAHLNGAEPKRVIVVPGRLVNVVI